MKVNRLVSILCLAAVVAMSQGCRPPPIRNLRLGWVGVERPVSPSIAVREALAGAPITLGVQDLRPDPAVVGLHQDVNQPVRTTDSVAQTCASQLASMLEQSGARLKEPPLAELLVQLGEYQVIEGSSFIGSVRMRAVVRRGAQELWSQEYMGTSKRWGRTHSPENFNQALSNALAEATSKLIVDPAFALALRAAVAPAPSTQPASTGA